MMSPAERSARPRPAALRGEVLRSERVSPAMVRIVVGGDGLGGFVPSVHADSYVKLVFLPRAAGDARPLTADGRVDLEAIRAGLDTNDQPHLRAYTVRGFDPQTLELTIDIVLHGEEGVAGPWAAGAVPGDEVLVLGPGGAYSPDTTADWHLLVGDASALPAIAVALERLAQIAPGARGVAIVEVHGPEEEISLVAPDGIVVRWVHQGTGVVGLRLVEAVRDHAWPQGRVHAFVHGEAGAVKELRHHLRVQRLLTRDQLSISGYWRVGADDEGWRAVKREWVATIDEAETAAGLD